MIPFLSSTYGLGTFLCKVTSLHIQTCYVLKSVRTNEGVSHVLAPAEPQSLSQIKKNKCVPVTCLNIIDWVGTHFFKIIFFMGKNIILCILKGILPFKMHKIIYFPGKPKNV